MSLLIAHRGASSEAPENTLAAIRRALEIGVDAVEIDVNLTADGELVVVHDAILGRTVWGAAGKKVSEVTLAEIQLLDAGSWFGVPFTGEKVPSLVEVLALDFGKAGLMIEVKRGHCALEPLAQAVVKTLGKAKHPPLVVGSFSVPLVARLKELNPALPLIGIVEDQHLLNSFDSVRPEHMALWYKLATPSVVAHFQEQGQIVWTFTVDDPRTAKFLVSIGVAGVISNCPRKMKGLPLFQATL